MTPLRANVLKLLRWSERYTRTDMVYLTGGSFWLGLGYAAQLASGIILAVALANLLPKEIYGNYQFIISMSAIIGGFTLTGMGTALMRSVAKGSSGMLPVAFKTQLRWSIGIVVVAAAVSAYYFIRGNPTLGSAFLVVGACTPLLSAFSLYRPYLEGRQRFRESTLLGAWRRPLPVIAILAALMVTDHPALLVLVYFASHTISMGLLYVHTLRLHAEETTGDPELIPYSKHLSVMGFVGLVANNVDNVIVFHYLGGAPVAAYTLAQLPLTHTLKFFSLGSNLIFPKFARKTFLNIRQTLGRKLLVYSVLAGTVVLTYILLAPYIFNLIFPAYPEAILYSQVLILAVLAKPFTLYAQAFAAHRMQKTQYVIQISVALVKLILLMLLLPIYGLWGAIASILITAAYWAGLVSVLFYRTKPESPASAKAF